ncbi:hypothetical protein BOO86_11310 [Mycobacterium sp. CBMA 234]|uniref:hypothetical protein n=1 Tax=Mycolicibacterium sp. CBMA 234 TaxID=1918495 RepID=UPI0012DDA04F|nr:hypothetical protein [Mycolicibacterium sp. CBMA 234]MUL65053.1 hypothetical protein [Mycolicibacterium sp. CBMA 234]
MNVSVMTDLAPGTTGTVAARSAVLARLEEAWLTTFGTDLPGGAIVDALVCCDVRMDQAGAFARIDEMIARSDIAVLSDADLAWLRPGDRPSDAIRWLMSRGPAILVVTHGHAAATGFAKSGSVRVRWHRDAVADAVHWERAFIGGLLPALTERGLLAGGAEARRRSIGPDDLRGILHDAVLR